MNRLLIASTAIIIVACGTGNNAVEAPSPQGTMSDVSVDSGASFEPMKQTFDVINSAGNSIGNVTITDERAGGVTLLLDLTAIPEGEHAIHFHEIGRCDTPDFTSSGGHYNPLDHNHGFDADAPNPHAGDMRNFTAPASGVVKTEIRNERVTLADRTGFAPLFDANHTALIIHAGPDDYQTQPTGAAGGRIACAVIAPS